MGDQDDKLVPRDHVIDSIKAEIELYTPSRRQRIFEAASSAIGKYRDGESQSQRDDLLTEWLQEHRERLQKLRATLEQMVLRLEGFGEEVEERIQSKEYLTLVRKTHGEYVAFPRRNQGRKPHDLHQMPTHGLRESWFLRQVPRLTLEMHCLQEPIFRTAHKAQPRYVPVGSRSGKTGAALPSGRLLDSATRQ